MTYSIVARDPELGRLGVAAQSHWFAVGSIVAWAAPGVGAVATQAAPEPAYGPQLLERIAAGAAPQTALAGLLADDPGVANRQVAVVDGAGQVAVHTGAGCIEEAGHVCGPGVSCQANMMARPGVPEAMLAAFSATADLSLADRLMACLDAGEATGGDLRGRQSAVLLVVGAEGEPWRRMIDLRVDDHPEPLEELRRLLALQRAYAHAEAADELAALGRHDEAAAGYLAAADLAPDSHELRFWAGLGAAQAGDWEVGLQHVRTAISRHSGWRELLARLPAELVPVAPEVLARLGR